MNKEEFIELIEGFENSPFIITCNGKTTEPLKYVKALSDSVKVLSNGKPAIFQYSKIENLSFDISTTEALPTSNKNDIPQLKKQYWENELEIAKSVITNEKLVLNERRDDIKKRVRNTAITKEWARIDSSFNDAKKNHSLLEKKDIILSMLDSLKNKYDCAEVSITLGMLFSELDDYKNAEKAFADGGDYYNAACCAQKTNNNDNVLLYLHNFFRLFTSYDSATLKLFFYIAAKVNNYTIVYNTIKNMNLDIMNDECSNVIYCGILCIISQNTEIWSRLDNYQDSKSNNIKYLIELFSEISNNLSESFEIYPLKSISVITHHETTNSLLIDKSSGNSRLYYGKINTIIRKEDNCSGFIFSKDFNNQIYFNIRQVEDNNLRKFLWNESKKNIDVSFMLGTGFEGMVADHILPTYEISISNNIFNGMIDSYNEYDWDGNIFGRIICNNKEYFFRDESIIDPTLREYFAKCFNPKNIYVNFTIKGKTAISRVWIDYDEEQNIIEEYSSFVSKKELEKFYEQKHKIENNIFEDCPFPYESLEPWIENEFYQDSTTENNLNQNLRSNENSSPKQAEKYYNLGINELLTKGTKYLTQSKDLKNAERCFLSVLDRNPERSHINTAVSNLVTIYQQENQADKALQLLHKYKNKIEKEKYNNQLLQIYDKVKRYDDLIILLKEVIPNAGKSKPHRIKQLITSYLKNNKASDAIATLKKYKNHIDELSYNNLYSSALESIRDYSGLESFLNNIVENTYRVEYKLNYMNKLALFYQKNGRVTEATRLYEQWKKYYISNRSNITMSTAVVAISKLELAVDRNLCILYYKSDRIEEAKSIAKNLLIKNSEDNIAQQILNDTYSVFNSIQPDLSDNSDEYMELDGVDDSIPKLLEWLLNNVDYERYLYNTNLLRNIKDSRYIADESQVQTDIKEALTSFKNRTVSEKSIFYIACAKIIKQLVDNGQKNEFVTQTKVNLFLGISLMLKADANIQSGKQSRESSRYYYFLSLRYLSRTVDMKKFFHAINMLYYSFFLSDNELEKSVGNIELESKLCITPPEYQDSVLSIKELMTCTFDLQIHYPRSKIGEEKIVRKIIDSIFANNKLRKEFSESISTLIDNTDQCQNADDYYGFWQNAKSKYNTILSSIQKCINSAIESINEPEKLNRDLELISNQNAERIFNKADIDYLKNTLKIFEQFRKANELSVVDDELNVLDKAMDLCENLEKDIHQNPTHFSCEVLFDVVTRLKNKAMKRKNNLYKDSKPVIKVKCMDTVYYKNNSNQSTFTFYIINEGNVQRADISNIQVSGVNNNIKIIGNPEHFISSVKGNSKDEYSVNFVFSDEEKKRQTFDTNISFDYSYHKEIDEHIKETYNEIHPINLSTLDSFVKITNKYNRYCDSGAVEDEMFYGREEDIENIVKSLAQGNGGVQPHRGIYMYGQKRAGKSSIMAHLEKRISECYPGKFLVANLGSIGSISENGDYEVKLKTVLIDVLEEILEENEPDVYSSISEKFDFREVTLRIEKQPDTVEFDRLLHAIEKALPNKIIMIFVDEFTYIYEAIQKKLCSPNFPHFWKTLLQNHQVCSIVIGQDNMLSFIEDIRYKNDFACMSPFPVSYLGVEGAKKLIYEPILDNGENRFEEEALDLIYKLTAGSAYLIMIICSQLVDYMNERGTSRVTKTTVETFVKKWLLNTSENPKAIYDFHFEAQLNDPCNYENSQKIHDDNKTLLKYIANHCNNNCQIKIEDINCVLELSERSKDYQNQILDQLIKRKVLIQEGDYCRILVDLLRIHLKG